MTIKITMDAIKAIKARSSLRQGIHQFFIERSYQEVDTPILVPLPGTELHLDYFASEWLDFHHKKHKRFLRSSPELHLKQSMSYGLERVYQIAPCFRNGGEASAWHNPEFHMLEWYEAGISYEDFMAQTEALIRHCHGFLVQAGFPCPKLPKTFQRLSVYEAFEEYTGIPLMDLDEDLAKKAIQLGHQSVRKEDDFETAFFKLLLDLVEPKLKEMEAVFLYDYPASQAALAQTIDGRAKRFELYLGGVELCNAFLELLDPIENEQRIRDTIAKRKQLGKQDIDPDPHFISAMKQGIPPCCGNALGFDRLLSLLLGLDNLQEVLPFHQNQIFPL